MSANPYQHTLRNYLDKNVTVTFRLLEQAPDCLTELSRIRRGRKADDHLPRLLLDCLSQLGELLNNHSDPSVIANLCPAAYQDRRFICHDRALPSEGLWPEHALHRTSLILQTEYGKAIALLCCAKLKVGNEAGNRRSRAALLLTQLSRGYGAKFCNQFEVSFESVPGDIK